MQEPGDGVIGGSGRSRGRSSTPTERSLPGPRSRRAWRPWRWCGSGTALFATLLPASALALVPQPGTQPGELSVALVSPQSCQSCHDFGGAHSPYRSWAGSMMANSARDPLMWAALAIAEQDVPEVGDMCLRCHTPLGWLEGRVTQGSPPPTDGSALIAKDMEGVSCHVCHRMTPGPGGQVNLQNAQIYVANDDVRRGPNAYDASVFEPPHAYAQSSFLSDARLCGQCHNVDNPMLSLRNAQGASTGIPFPIERTYDEWRQSSYSQPSGQTCQACHMPAVADVRSCTFTDAPLHTVRRHDFAGGNAWVPTILAGEFPELGRGAHFAAATAKAMEMLEQKSANVSVSVVGPVLAGKTATVRVRVTNLTGHKLPTGYAEGRRMWIEVSASASSGLVLASGVYDPAEADIVPDPQLKVYEMVQGIWGEGASFHFVLNDYIVKDNRIPPLGFLPTTDTAPVGASFQVLAGGVLAHYDDTDYQLELPATATGPLSVTARVRYQTASREYIEFLRDENVTNQAGQRVHALWQAYGKSPPVTMAATSTTAPIIPCVPSPEICNGLDDDCNDLVDDELGVIDCGEGACSQTVPACLQGVPQQCAPFDPKPETCNGLDDDCNGLVDDGLADVTCGVGGCAASAPGCVDGAPGACVPLLPAPEECNGLDDDCNGLVDDGLDDCEPVAGSGVGGSGAGGGGPAGQGGFGMGDGGSGSSDGSGEPMYGVGCVCQAAGPGSLAGGPSRGALVALLGGLLGARLRGRRRVRSSSPAG